MFVCDYGKNKKFLLYLAWILANSSARWVTQGESLSPASDLANEGAAEIQACAERLLELRECVTRVGTIARLTVSMEPPPLLEKVSMGDLLPGFKAVSSIFKWINTGRRELENARTRTRNRTGELARETHAPEWDWVLEETNMATSYYMHNTFVVKLVLKWHF